MGDFNIPSLKSLLRAAVAPESQLMLRAERLRSVAARKIINHKSYFIPPKNS